MKQSQPMMLPKASQWLRERRLVTLHEDEVDSLQLLTRRNDQSGSTIDGLVLVGANATTTARGVRARYPDLMVLVEPKPTASALATAEAPFVLPMDGLFQPSLADLIVDRLANEDDYALTPTGYVSLVEPDGLKAIVDQANAIETERLIVTLPLESGWLKSTHRDQLIAIMNRSRHPLLVSLGSKGDPLDSSEKADGLVVLLGETDNVSFTRADHLVGMEVFARSASAVAFGTIPSRRRTTPPGTRGYASDKTERRPHIYFPTLHRFMRGGFARQLFANTPPPSCDQGCCGRPLDEFRDTPEDHTAAMNHNISKLIAGAARITGTYQRRLDVLQQMYEEAEAEHRIWAGRIGRPLKVPSDQHRFGQLSGGLTTTARKSTR